MKMKKKRVCKMILLVKYFNLFCLENCYLIFNYELFFNWKMLNMIINMMDDFYYK